MRFLTARVCSAADIELGRAVEFQQAFFHPSSYTLAALEGARATPPYRDELYLFAECGGELAASVLCWLDPESGTAEHEPVGTHPHHRRRGIAAALCRLALGRARELGAKRALLQSVAGDHPSRGGALYASLGCRRVGRDLNFVRPAATTDQPSS